MSSASRSRRERARLVRAAERRAARYRHAGVVLARIRALILELDAELAELDAATAERS